MLALIVLLALGGGGIVLSAHWLWIVLLVAVVLWVLGWAGPVEPGASRRWGGRWR